MYAPWLKEVHKRTDFYREAFHGLPDEEITENLITLVLAAGHKTRTYSRVPAKAMQDFINIVTPALEVMVGALNSGKHDLFSQALQSFCIIPQFALVKHAKDTATDLAHRIFEFREGPREEGAKRPRAPQEPIPPGGETLPPRIKKALAQCKFLAAEGRFQRASQRLSQAADEKEGALEPTEEILEQLRRLHPAASEPLFLRPMEFPTCLSSRRSSSRQPTASPTDRRLMCLDGLESFFVI